ncbi:MAG: hypothetical protein P4M13_06855 [Alphaproteobacteria bacterium]|nr:hypothetical protein [Alphaproteobacteria bacterium]
MSNKNNSARLGRIGARGVALGAILVFLTACAIEPVPYGYNGWACCYSYYEYPPYYGGYWRGRLYDGGGYWRDGFHGGGYHGRYGR